MEQKIFTVGELIDDVNARIAGLSGVTVEAEVSSFKVYNGHWYFTVKDQSASMSCAMWRGKNYGRQPLKIGDKIKLKGYPQIYAPNGGFKFITDSFNISGEGELYERVLRLKKELEALGWFDKKYKKAIPRIPRRIGIITSSGSAALKDAIHRLRERAPYVAITIYHTPVQGKGNEKNIARVVEYANRLNKEDVLLLIRGGGSIEDLWNFNERRVAESIFRSRIPIISGIGHETDTTIADLVADMRAPTPTGAAEAAAEKETVLRGERDALWSKVEMSFGKAMDRRNQDLDFYGAPIENINALLNNFKRQFELASNLVYVDLKGCSRLLKSAVLALKNNRVGLFDRDRSDLRLYSEKSSMLFQNSVRAASLNLESSGAIFSSHTKFLGQYKDRLGRNVVRFSLPLDEYSKRCDRILFTLRQEEMRNFWEARKIISGCGRLFQLNRPKFSSVRLQVAAQMIGRSMNQQLKLDKNKFENLDRILFILEEARKQQKNTAFILKNGALLSSINQIKEGDDIEVVFPDGSFYARVGAVRS